MQMSLSSRVSDFEKLDDRFTKGKCYVMALGKNRNKSHFSKDSVENAFPTLAYIPVVAHLMETQDGKHYVGGHDEKLEIKNDSISIKSLCTSYGFVFPTSEKPVYETVVENGTEVEYLVANVVFWTGKFPELMEAKYDDDTLFGQSMEILLNYNSTQPLEEDNSFTDITDFSYDALCLLNKSDDPTFHVEPCFPNASVISYSKSELQENLQEMIKEFKALFSKKEEEKGENMKKDKEVVVKEKKKEEFSLTFKQRFEALGTYFDSARKDEKEDVWFSILDFTEEEVWIRKYNWDNGENKFYKCTYSIGEEDNITVSEEWTEYVQMLVPCEEVDKINGAQEMFEKYKAEYSHSNSEVEELIKYKEDNESKKREVAESTLFAEFEEIKETKEFIELVANSKDYTIDQLEKVCYAIVGRLEKANKKDKAKFENCDNAEKELIFSVEKSTVADIPPYDGIIEKHLNKK